MGLCNIKLCRREEKRKKKKEKRKKKKEKEKKEEKERRKKKSLFFFPPLVTFKNRYPAWPHGEDEGLENHQVFELVV